MFSRKEKIAIADAVEKIILVFKHPEMPKEKPNFRLHIDGKEPWSWADIEPNWKFDDKNKPTVNQWNENAREIM